MGGPELAGGVQATSTPVSLRKVAVTVGGAGLSGSSMTLVTVTWTAAVELALRSSWARTWNE